ncbi:hypothetical protein ACR259_09090, partial [Aerococcus viridans]
QSSLSEKIKKDDPDSLSGSSFVGSVTLFFYLFSLTVGFHRDISGFFICSILPNTPKKLQKSSKNMGFYDGWC